MLFHFKCLYSVSLRTQPQCLSTACVNKFQILHPPCLGHKLETHTWVMSGTHQGDSQARLTHEHRLDWIPNQGSLMSAQAGLDSQPRLSHERTGWAGGAGIISTKAHSGALAESGSHPSGPENFRPGKAPAAGARLGCCLPKQGVTQTPQIYRPEQKPPTKFKKKGVVFRIASKTFRFGTSRG